VISIDANLLIYGHLIPSSNHQPARHWLDEQRNGSTPVGRPWPTMSRSVQILPARAFDFDALWLSGTSRIMKKSRSMSE
jgi:predicted nucleic acid-binding protein